MSWWFKIDLWKRVILALVLGLGVGLGLRYGMGADAGGAFAERWISWAGDLFLRLIRMLIVPLIFFTLVSGIIAMGDPKRLGSLGVRTLATYFG
ncbi:MAG: cation:dicarboxylase symporter family transporter, partial [Pseudomonadota bacterium]